jgi:hypothetical protein
MSKFTIDFKSLVDILSLTHYQSPTGITRGDDRCQSVHNVFRINFFCNVYSYCIEIVHGFISMTYRSNFKMVATDPGVEIFLKSSLAQGLLFFQNLLDQSSNVLAHLFQCKIIRVAKF